MNGGFFVLINDQSCISEKTILRYQENGIIDLLGSDWYGIMLMSSGRQVDIDTCHDRSNIGDQSPLEFARNCISWDSLSAKEIGTHEYKGLYYLVYPIRQTSRGYQVFFMHCRRDKQFDEKDVKWYTLYSAAAHQRLLLENELVQEKDYLLNILESTYSCIAVVDAKYNVISANDPARAIFGNNLNNAPGGTLLILIKAVNQVLAGYDKVCLPRMVYDEPDSRYGFSIYNFTVTPLHNSKGVVSCAVIVADDITLELIGNQRIYQRQYFEAMGAISFELSRDLSTPLMNIDGCASIIKSDQNLSEDSKELLAYIQNEVGNIRQVDEQMLSFTNITQNNTYTCVDLNDILKNCISLLYREKMMKKLKVISELEKEPLLLRAKNVDMQQLFLNLLLSALNSIPNEGTIRVDSRHKVEGNCFEIEISDTGIGILPNEELRPLRMVDMASTSKLDLNALLAKKILLDYGGTLDISIETGHPTIRKAVLPCNTLAC